MKHLGGGKKTGAPPAPLPAGNLPNEAALSPHRHSPLKGGNEGETPRTGPPLPPHSLGPRLPARPLLLPSPIRIRVNNKNGGSARTDKEEQPPRRRCRRRRPPPPPRPGPKRKANLPITESLLFPRIHYHQCPACECVSGEGGEWPREAGRRARRRRAGGSTGTRARRALGDSQHLPVTGAGAPGPSPSVHTTLTLSPGSGANYTAAAANRGEGGKKTRPAQPRGERLPPPPSPPLAPPPPPLLPPPPPLPGPSPPPAAAAAAGAAAAAPPTTSGQLGGCGLRQTSAVSAAPLLSHPRSSSPPRSAPERRLRQTSARPGLPLPLRPGSRPRDPSALSGYRCFSSRSRPATAVPV